MKQYVLSEAALEQLAAASADVVLIVDRDGRIIHANQHAAALGRAAQDLPGQRLGADPALHALRPLWVEMLETGAACIRREIDLPPVDGAAGGSIYVTLLSTDDYAPLDQPGTHLDAALARNTTLAAMMRSIVHELKVPIAAIKSFIDLTTVTGDLNPAQQRYMQRSQLSLDAMLELVHELLDMAWLESHNALKRTEANLNRLVDHAAAQLEGYARRQGVTLRLELDPTACQPWIDERRLHGALLNLIGNAIKYSPDGGDVVLRVIGHADRVEVQVEDHGLGISPEHLARIFEPFYRVRTAETQRIEGSGLGLGIFKAVIELHGGVVSVSSTPGQGSVFGFWLPCTPPDA